MPHAAMRHQPFWDRRVPFGRQTTHFSSSLSTKRECSAERVKRLGVWRPRHVRPGTFGAMHRRLFGLWCFFIDVRVSKSFRENPRRSAL